MNLTTESLLASLKKKGINANVQQETGQIFFGFNAHNEQFAIFLRIYKESQLLQIIVFQPIHFKAETAGETARLLHWVNQAIDLPGFGMEEGSKTIFYRIMLPAIGMEIDEKLFEPFLAAMKGVSETFYPPIKKVAEGASFEDVSKEIGQKQ